MTDQAPTLRDLVGSYLATNATVVLDSEAALRAGTNVIHETRVAVRRLRSTVRVFADLFDVPQAGRLEEELGWWAGLLGKVRDLDVLGERLAAKVAALAPELVLGPVSSTLATEVAVRRGVAFDAVQAMLDTDRYRQLTDLLHRWRSDPPFTPRADRPAGRIKPYVNRAGTKVTRRLDAALAAVRAGESSAELLHRARKAGKRSRYALEAAEPLWGERATRLIAERRALQDVLGDHQDSVVSAAFLREIGAQAGVRDGQNGFTYGVLHATETALAERLPVDLAPFR